MVMLEVGRVAAIKMKDGQVLYVVGITQWDHLIAYLNDSTPLLFNNIEEYGRLGDSGEFISEGTFREHEDRSNGRD